jgi:alpha-D-glucose phosphate-specific phosphoglucomutase
MAEITFGTDGWRAIIAADFTFTNVSYVAQAIAHYLQQEGLAERGLVVGYDTRFLADRFAQVVTEVMAGNGIHTYLCVKYAPTPAVAHAVLAQRAGGAVMLTASHNPAEYLGIKFIPHYAGPALPAEIDPIVANLQQVVQSGKVRQLTLTGARRQGLVTELEPLPAYTAHVESLLDFTAIKKAGLKVVVDPMYGAGIGYVESILSKHGCAVTAIHNRRDPLFGGKLPDPSAAHLEALRQQVQADGADLGVALDGDADRLGVIDPDGRYYSPNEILTLFMEYLLQERGCSGAVARTVATTHMLDRLAEHYGCPVLETPVGFKYIGQALREQNAFLGGEESGGVSINGHLPEKDGIFAALLFIEMLAKTGQTAAALLDSIKERFGPVYTERLDLRTTAADKTAVMEKMAHWQPPILAGREVAAVNRLDGLKLILDNGSWCLVRPSGTEPVFRIYTEAASEAEKTLIQNEVKKSLFG